MSESEWVVAAARLIRDTIAAADAWASPLVHGSQKPVVVLSPDLRRKLGTQLDNLALVEYPPRRSPQPENLVFDFAPERRELAQEESNG